MTYPNWSPKIDSQRRSARARKKLPYERGQLARDLVHVGDHQQRPCEAVNVVRDAPPDSGVHRAGGAPSTALDHLRTIPQLVLALTPISSELAHVRDWLSIDVYDRARR